MSTPTTGKKRRTPSVTSPCTKSETIITLCRGTDITFNPIPLIKTLFPVYDSLEKDRTFSEINNVAPEYYWFILFRAY